MGSCRWGYRLHVMPLYVIPWSIDILYPTADDQIDQQHLELGLTPEDFHTPFLSERLDAMDMPVEWLNSQPNRKTIHILSHPFLFTPATLVMYFRAMNHAAMFKAFESSMTAARLCMQMSQIAGRGESRLFARLRTAMTNYLVLEIRRDNVLTGALNQLWRRERRELMRPLKVRMGMDEGEEGVDHGGVQQEFFRIAMSEALKPEYGKQSGACPCSVILLSLS